MPTLLHIDSSLNINGPSVSRTHTAAFVKEWLQQNPEGKVIRRDLAAEPLPHLDEADYYAETTPALRETLASEMEEADIILIGAPMHNFSIPSTLKAWIDQACIMGRTTGPDSTTAGTTTIVITSRGGGYGPGTPNEDKEFVTTYLDKVLNGMFGLEPEFIVSDLTLANTVPAMAHLKDIAATNREAAKNTIIARARELASVNA